MLGQGLILSYIACGKGPPRVGAADKSEMYTICLHGYVRTVSPLTARVTILYPAVFTIYILDGCGVGMCLTMLVHHS